MVLLIWVVAGIVFGPLLGAVLKHTASRYPAARIW